MGDRNAFSPIEDEEGRFTRLDSWGIWITSVSRAGKGRAGKALLWECYGGEDVGMRGQHTGRFSRCGTLLRGASGLRIATSQAGF